MQIRRTGQILTNLIYEWEFLKFLYRIRSHSVVRCHRGGRLFWLPSSPARDNHLADIRHEDYSMAGGEEFIWDIQMQFHRAGQILTNLIFEREFLLFPYRVRSHSAIDDTMAADFSRSYHLLRQTITLQTSDMAAIALGFVATSEERLRYGHGIAALQVADAYVLQTLMSTYDGGHKRRALAEGYEVGFEEHC